VPRERGRVGFWIASLALAIDPMLDGGRLFDS